MAWPNLGSKRFTIDLVDYSLLWLNRNGELFVVGRKEEVNVYDIVSKEIKKVANRGRDGIRFMDAFVETLALLN